MDIVKASINNVGSLYKLEEEVFPCPWTREQFEYEITSNEFSRSYVILDNNELIGYIFYWIIFDQGQLNKICVKEEYRHLGLGSKLMDLMMEDFKNNDCNILSLEVRKSNIDAQKLYEKYGFFTALIKPNYYTDGEDAAYMVKGI